MFKVMKKIIQCRVNRYLLLFMILFEVLPISAQLNKVRTDVDIESENKENQIISTGVPGLESETVYYLWGVDIPWFSPDFSFNKRLFKKILGEDTIESQTDTPTKQMGLLPDLQLGKDSRILITGRKSVKISYSYKHFPFVTVDNFQDSSQSGRGAQKFDSKFDIKQEMQVKVEGQINNRIFISVDYDDTLDEKNRQNINLLYKGTEDEILQTAEIGNITLALPNTEFISFSKKLFGVRTYSKFGPLKHYMILSKQEGETASSSFSGSTMIDQRDIIDLGFAKNFFSVKLGMPTVTLPLKNVHVYVDNLNPYDNENCDKEITYNDVTYYFYESTRETDFFIDLTTGIIDMRSSDWQSGILVIEFEDANGVKYGLLQDGLEPLFLWDKNLKTSVYQMKNKYYTGLQNIDLSNFKVKILRENKDENILIGSTYINYVNIFNLSSSPDGSISPQLIDIATGVITFPQDFPFDLLLYPTGTLIPELSGLTEDELRGLSNTTAYQISGQKTKYSLRFEYKSPLTEYKLNAFDIIENTERVTVDGRPLVRGTHYRIDYLTGVVTILDPSQINVNSNVQITFEYHPFFAAQSKTLFGTRVEYDFRDEDRYKIGVTYISESAPENKDDEVPRFGEEPFSNSVYGVNALATLDDSFLQGLKMKLRAEFARSEVNPNTSGKVLIDDMEGSEVIRSLSTSRSAWFVASLPSTESFDQSNRYDLINIDIPEAEVPLCFFVNSTVVNNVIRPNFGTSSRQTLVFQKMPNDSSKVFSFAQRISKFGEDFSKYKYLEIWYKIDSTVLEGETITLELGGISEDADGDGNWDNEDDGDGLLEDDEDDGYDFDINGIAIKYGAGNNEIDNEDSNGDGQLKWDENSGMQVRTTIQLASEDATSHNGWIIKKIPLSDFSGPENVLSSVQFLRVYGTGFSSGGSMRIAKIDLVGTAWEADEETITEGNVLTVSTIDNISSPDYVPLHNETDKETSAIKKDVSVELNFLMDNNYTIIEPREGFCTKEYGAPRDLTKYKTFRVYYFPKNHPITPPYSPVPYRFIVRLMTTSTDYYEFSQLVYPDETGWKYIDISIQNLSEFEVGKPSLQSIYRMQIGVSSYEDKPYRGIIYVNDVLLMDADTLVGDAGSFEFSTSFKEYGSLSYFFTQRDGTYSLIGENPRNIDTKTQTVSMRFDPGRLLFGQTVSTATSASVSSSITTNNNDLFTTSIVSSGENKSDRLMLNTTFNIQNYPVISYSYNFSKNVNSMIADPNESLTQAQNVRLDYAVPVVKALFLTVTPSRVSFSFNERRNKSTYAVLVKNNVSTVSNDWNADMAWTLIENLQLSGRYALQEQWDDIKDVFTSQRLNTTVSGSYSKDLHKMVTLRSNYSNITSANWDLRTAESQNTYYSYRVNGTRNYSSGLSIKLIELLDVIPGITKNFDINVDYSNGLTHSYENVEKKPDINFYLGLYSSYEDDFTPKLKSDTDRYALSHTTTILDRISTRLQYSFSETQSQGVSGISIVESREWPSGSISVSDWNGVPLFELLQQMMSVQSISINYRQTESFNKTSTEIKTISKTPSMNWNITWKNNLRTDLMYSLSSSERLKNRAKSDKEQKTQASIHAEYTVQLKKKMTSFLSNDEREVNTSMKLTGDIRYTDSKTDNAYSMRSSNFQGVLGGTYNFSDEMRLNAGLTFTKFRTNVITQSYNEYKLEVGFEVLF